MRSRTGMLEFITVVHFGYVWYSVFVKHFPYTRIRFTSCHEVNEKY